MGATHRSRPSLYENSSTFRRLRCERLEDRALLADFSLLIGSGIVGTGSGQSAWGDYDNDGRLDLVVTGDDSSGNKVAKLYHNDGGGAYHEVAAGLSAVDNSAVAWGDYDNDGRLDLLLAGCDSSYNFITKLYHNDGGGAFHEVAAGLPGLENGSLAWGDYDNDGLLDIFLAGRRSGVDVFAAIYHNDGNGAFHDIGAGLVQVSDAAGAWADYDCDGWLDLLVTGQAGFQGNTQLYHNDGHGTFHAVSSGLPRIWAASVAWGDYDNDGLLDIAMTGLPDSGRMAAVFHNDGNGSFRNISAGLRDVSGGSVAWGDYDSDGRLDLLLTGYYYDSPSSYGSVAHLYHNDGSGFQNNLNAGLQGALLGTAAWMDHDNDGKLDVLITGTRVPGESCVSLIYHNDTAAANAPPAAPAGLSASILSDSSVMLSWTAPADGQTPSAGLSYTLRIGTTPGGVDALTPMSDPATGWRRLAQPGMLQTTCWRFDNVVAGQTFYWSVQAVDAALAGSAFAVEGSFVTPRFTEVGTGISGACYGASVWGDYDNDGLLDLLVTGGGDASGTPMTKLYHNDGGGAFHEVAAGLPNISNGVGAWADYDNDGRLDILLVGDLGFYQYVASIYHNDGGGAFHDIGAGLGLMAAARVAWGDYDNDGRLDLLMVGNSFSEPYQSLTRLYHNDGNNVFSLVSSGLPGFECGSVDWGDYDNDGRLDIAICGSSRDLAACATRIYHNEGDGTFRDIAAGLPPVGTFGSVAWGDYDNDGRLDLLVQGKDHYPAAAIAKVFHNDGGGAFHDCGASLTGLFYGMAAWGDYDNDGRLDILASGTTQSNTRVALIYRNDGNGRFHDIATGMTGLEATWTSWADYDNDGRLDALTSGFDWPTMLPLTKLYRNNTVVANTVPAAPTGLGVTENEPGSFTLSWNAATDNQTPASGLSYNLRVGTTPGGSDVIGPMAQASGTRAIAQRGPIEGTSWTLTGLASGTYYWSVQAVDAALTGSPFAAEGSFVCRPPRIGRDVAIDFGIGGAWLWKDNSQWKCLTGQNPVCLAAGDFDGNRQTDVAFSLPNGGGTWICFDSSTWQSIHSRAAQRALAADLDGDGRNEIVFDFGANAGIWEYLPATKEWKCLRGDASTGLARADLDGNGQDDLLVGLPGQGTWVYRNNSTWQQLHKVGATAMAGGDMDGNRKDELLLSFPGGGTWIYTDAGQWQQLHGATALAAAVGDMNGDRFGEAVLNLGASHGTWEYDPASRAWKLLCGSGASLVTFADVDNSGLADAVLYLGACNGTWLCKNDSAWQLLHAAPAEAVASDYGPSPSAGRALAKYGTDVATGFGGGGTWLWRNASQWQSLHSQTAVSSTVGDFDGNGQADVMLSFSAGGTWIYSNDATWQCVSSGTAQRMVAADLDGDRRDEAIVDFGASGGIWKYTPSTRAWTSLRGGTAACLARTDLDGNGQDDVVMALDGGGTWVYANGVSWQMLHRATAAVMAAGDLDGNGREDLVLGFTGAGSWALLNNSQWLYLHSVTAQAAALADMNGDGRAEVVVSFGPGHGTWKYVFATRAWTLLHSQAAIALSCADVDSNGRVDVLLSFASGGTWVYRNDSTWQHGHGLAAQWIATAYRA